MRRLPGRTRPVVENVSTPSQPPIRAIRSPSTPRQGRSAGRVATSAGRSRFPFLRPKTRSGTAPHPSNPCRDIRPKQPTRYRSTLSRDLFGPRGEAEAVSTRVRIAGSPGGLRVQPAGALFHGPRDSLSTERPQWQRTHDREGRRTRRDQPQAGSQPGGSKFSQFLREGSFGRPPA